MTNKIKNCLARKAPLLIPIWMAGAVAFGIHTLYEVNQKHRELMEQNPVLVKNNRAITLYGFNEDDDPEIDRIVESGFLGGGPRPGIPAPLYREYRKGDDGFEGKLKEIISLGGENDR